MVVMDFLEKMTKMEILTHVGLDDFADRLIFLFTVWMLILMSSITTAKTYFLTPIICYVPNIVGSHEGQAAYITNFCYTEGTYNVPLSEFKIDNHNPNWLQAYSDRKIYYYQWLPFVLGLQGILCYLPRLLWQLFLSGAAGADLMQLVKQANELQRTDRDRREKMVKQVTKQLEFWLRCGRAHEDTVSCSLCCCCKLLGCRLLLAYSCLKLFHIANIVGQLLMMSQLLQLRQMPANRGSGLLEVTAKFGWQLLSALCGGSDWQNTQAFPRSGCCAVETRQAAGANFVFAQCALPVNMLHEKIYILLWFWYILLLLCCCCSVLLWVWRLCTEQRRCQPLTKLAYLTFESEQRKNLNTDIPQFSRHLKLDGCFLLSMLSFSCGTATACDIFRELYIGWQQARRSMEQQQPMRSSGEPDCVPNGDVDGAGDKSETNPLLGKFSRALSSLSINSSRRRKAMESLDENEITVAMEPSAPPPPPQQQQQQQQQQSV